MGQRYRRIEDQKQWPVCLALSQPCTEVRGLEPKVKKFKLQRWSPEDVLGLEDRF